MRQTITILTIFFLAASTANAKLIMIDIQKKLVEAKHIQTIVVFGYSNSTMRYGLVGANDTLTIGNKIREISEQFRLTLIDKSVMKQTDLSGKWPEPGDTVLVLINDRNRVELFAKKITDKFRFWDPNSNPYANSVFSITEGSSFLPLEDCSKKQESLTVNKHWICTDGCLVLVTAIKER